MTPEQAAEELVGTCRRLEEVVTDEITDAMSELEYKQFLTTLDAIVMCCEICSWWVDTHEIDEEGCCEDCSEDS